MDMSRRRFLAINAVAPLLAVSGTEASAHGLQQDPALAVGEKWLTTLPIPNLKPTDGPPPTHVLSGIISHYCLVHGNGIDAASATIAVDLGGHYRSFRCVVGIDSKYNGVLGPSQPYAVELDGKSLAAGKVEQGGKPVFLTLDVTGGRSLSLTLGPGVGFGNGIVSRKSTEEGKEAEAGPSLLEPADGAKVTEETVDLRWKPVAGATTYLVQLVQKKRLGKRRTPDVKGWVFTVSNETSYMCSLKEMPSGEYLWSILAFDDEQVVGGYSADRKFTLVR